MEKKDLKKIITEARKQINILERPQRGEIRKKEKYQELERTYNVKIFEHYFGKIFERLLYDTMFNFFF